MSENPQQHAPTVFVSYKWAGEDENAWVERLARDLRHRGIDALLDRWEVRLGESFSDYMTSAINRSDAFLFVITDASVAAIEAPGTGGAVRFEVQLASARRIAGNGFRFIGILRQGERAPWHLHDARYIDFRDDAQYRHSLAALVADLAGVTFRPELPTRQDVSLLAEPAVFRLWQRLPHGGALLVEPASAPVQEEILRGVVELAQAECEKRGYDLTMLDAIIPREHKSIDLVQIVEHMIGDGVDIDLAAFDGTGFGVRHLFGRRDWKDSSPDRRRLVMFFRISEPFSEDHHRILTEVRRLVVFQHAGSPSRARLTVVLMAQNMCYDFPTYCSPWWNVFDLIRVA